MTSEYSSDLVPTVQSGMVSYPHYVFSSWWSWLGEDHCRREMSSCLWSWEPLTGGPTWPDWQSQPAWQTSNRQVAHILQGHFKHPPPHTHSFWTSQATHPLQTFFVELVIKTRQPANRGELFGLQTCCWGQRLCRVWSPFCGMGPAPDEQGHRLHEGLKDERKRRDVEPNSCCVHGEELQNASIHHIS